MKPLLYLNVRSAFELREGIFHYYYYYYYYYNYYYYYYYLLLLLLLFNGGGGGDDRPPVITAAFIVCQIGKFITLYINTMRSADRPRKARSDLPKEGVIES